MRIILLAALCGVIARIGARPEAERVPSSIVLSIATVMSV